MSSNTLVRTHDGAVESSDGWAVRMLAPELLEYRSGTQACLVNVVYSQDRRAREIFATESLSDLFPNLREHLQTAAGMLQGNYVVV